MLYLQLAPDSLLGSRRRRRRGEREGVCSMTAVGQNSWRRSCDGRYYLFCRWLDPILVPVPAVVASPVRSHPFVVAVGRQSPRRSSAADNQAWPTSRIHRQPRSNSVSPFVLCNICRRVPSARAKVSFALVHREGDFFLPRRASI